MTTLSSSSCSSSSSSSSANTRLPTGDSPYVRAKHVQLVDKDPNKAVPLFWAAINNGDRVDSALKDMAVVMKQLNRTEEAIEAIKSFRSRCSINAQDPIDNLLLDLYKKCGRMEDQIELLKFKLKLIDEGLAFGGRTTKLSRSQGKRFHASLDKERSRLLGNLAWAYMQTENYQEAEPLYRRALAIENDYNKQCNRAICLMKTGRFSEAKTLLQAVPKPSSNYNGDPYLKSFERAFEIVAELQQSTLHANKEAKGVQGDARSIDVPELSNELYSPPYYVTPHSEFRRGRQIQNDEAFQFPRSDVSITEKGVKKEKAGEKHRIKGSRKGSRTLSTDGNVKSGSWKNGFSTFPNSVDESLQAQSEPSNSSNEERICADNTKEEDLFLTPTSIGILEGNMAASGEALSQGYIATDEEKRNNADQVRANLLPKAPQRHINSCVNSETTGYPVKKTNRKLGVPIPLPFPFGAAEGKGSPGVGSDAISQGATGVNGGKKKQEAEKYAIENKNVPCKSLRFGCSHSSLNENLTPIVGRVEKVIGEEGFKTSSVSSKGRRTWADMVEEEEEEDLMARFSASFMKWDEKNVFADENVNSNTTGSIPQQKPQIERLCKNLNKIDINVGSRSARRSLSFNLEGCSNAGTDAKRKNRLQVFREITPDD